MAELVARRGGLRPWHARRDAPGDKSPRRPRGIPELVVVMRPQAAFRASAGRFRSAAGEKVSDVGKLLASTGRRWTRSSEPTEERVMARQAAESAGGAGADGGPFRLLQGRGSRGALAELQTQLARSELVEAAYVKPRRRAAQASTTWPRRRRSRRRRRRTSPPGRSISIAPPSGIDARWAWTQAGGRGRDIRIIDIEGAWRFTHEDLTQNQGGVVAGTQIAGSRLAQPRHGGPRRIQRRREHGRRRRHLRRTRSASAVSHGGIGSAAAINQAASRLERRRHHPPRDASARAALQLRRARRPARLHRRRVVARRLRRDPATPPAAASSSSKPPATARRTSTTRSIRRRRPGFPAGWRNSFRRTNRDSGAIVVGAGAPPPGTHGRNHGPDRSRLDFSNWGALIDAQGWGREVTTLRLRRSAGRRRTRISGTPTRSAAPRARRRS